MFRLPEYYEVEMSFDDAVKMMKSRANGDLLKGLESMDQLWTDYCASDDQDDDEFYETWQYEMSAYNTVVEAMRPLFV